MQTERNSHPINLKISTARLNKLKAKQVEETLKQGKAVSLQAILAQLIDEMVVEQPLNEWQAIGQHLRDMIESQPAEISVEQFVEHQKKVRSIKRTHYIGNRYTTPVAFYSSEVE